MLELNQDQDAFLRHAGDGAGGRRDARGSAELAKHESPSVSIGVAVGGSWVIRSPSGFLLTNRRGVMLEAARAADVPIGGLAQLLSSRIHGSAVWRILA